MPVAAPLISAGVGLVANKLANRKSSEQKQYEAASLESAKQQTELSKSLANYSKDQYALTKPALSQAMGLYSRLAGGDRATVQSAIAPEVANINEQYRGAGKYLEQQGMRGGARDYALADLNRQRVGQLATLPMAGRWEGAGKLASLGQSGTAAGLSGMAGAAGANAGAAAAYGNLANQAFQQQQTRGQGVSQFASNLAGILVPWMLGQKGGGVLPSTSTVPNIGGLPG
jgi:hypothetical protein